MNLIIEAVNDASELKSKLTDEVINSVGGFTSSKIRHLMNNLGNLVGGRYLEIGSHRGATFVSACYKNPVHGVAVDNFTEFDDGTVEKDFIDNCNKFINLENQSYTFLKQNCWDLLPVNGPFRLFLYDGPHSYEEQRKAISHFLPLMENKFIMCIDDASWDDVSRGTDDGLKDANLKVHMDLKLDGKDGDVNGWWNGFRVLLLEQP